MTDNQTPLPSVMVSEDLHKTEPVGRRMPITDLPRRRTRFRAFINLLGYFSPVLLIVAGIGYYMAPKHEVELAELARLKAEQRAITPPPVPSAPIPIIAAVSPPPAEVTPPAPSAKKTFTYRMGEGQWVRSALMACNPKQRETDAMAWFEANNPGVDPDLVKTGTPLQFPCPLTLNKVWWGPARIACFRGAWGEEPGRKAACLRQAAEDWLIK